MEKLKWENVYEKLFYLSIKWWYHSSIIYDKVVISWDVLSLDMRINNPRFPELSEENLSYIAVDTPFYVIKWSSEDFLRDYWDGRDAWRRYEFKPLNEVLLDKSFITGICNVFWNDKRNIQKLSVPDRRFSNYHNLWFYSEDEFDKFVYDYTKALSIAILERDNEKLNKNGKSMLENFITDTLRLYTDGSKDQYCWWDFEDKIYK